MFALYRASKSQHGYLLEQTGIMTAVKLHFQGSDFSLIILEDPAGLKSGSRVRQASYLVFPSTFARHKMN